MFSRYLVAVAILFFCSLAWASPGRWVMGVDVPLAVLEDRAGSLSVEEVAALPDSAFRPLSSGFSAGYTESVYWLKFSPPAQGGGELLLELSPSYVDEIVLFEPGRDGWRKRITGDHHPYAEREIGYRNFVFRLPPDDAGKVLLLRVRSTSTLAVRGVFWEPAAFTNAVIPESAIAGAYFGIFGLSALLALAYGIWLRSRQFFAYALLAGVAMVAIASLNGILAQVLLPRSPATASVMTGVFVFLIQGCVIWFSTILLETAKYFPRFHRVMLAVALVLAVSSVSAFTEYYRWFIAVLNPLSTLLQASGAVLALLLVRRKVAGARFFAFTYTLHAAAILPSTLLVIGLMPPNFITLYGWQAESLVHILLLHSAMLWRVRKNDEQHRDAQELALAASLETERQLEKRVSERTQALTDAHGRLEAALASEQRALLEQRQFMAMVSHEFRTPLAIIDSVAINLTEVPASDSADTAARGEQLRRATRRLARLVDNCLTDERVDHAAFSPQLERVSPAMLAREAAEIVSLPPRHRLVLALEGLPETIECDPTLIRIALSNLLDNAVKYSDGGAVELTGSADGDRVRFTVGDEGPGLNDDDIERLFERFARGAAKKSGGAGLGLYVARRIARLHGGDISARNKPGGGAVFEFVIRRGASGANLD